VSIRREVKDCWPVRQKAQQKVFDVLNGVACQLPPARASSSIEARAGQPAASRSGKDGGGLAECRARNPNGRRQVEIDQFESRPPRRSGGEIGNSLRAFSKR